MDQLEKLHNITQSFFPDLSSSNFNRPTPDMNITAGCPRFVSHEIVEMPTYYDANGDCIFVQIIIEVPKTNYDLINHASISVICSPEEDCSAFVTETVNSSN